MIMEYSKSKKKSQNNQINVQNQKLMMKISSSKNGSGIASVILLGGVFITAALGSAFLVERKRRKSTQKITKKEKSENFEDESSKGLHFLLPDSSPCAEQQQPSSNDTEKLGVTDSTLLLPDSDHELNEVSLERIEVIQGNEKTEVAHVHQAQATILYNPSQGEVSELQHTGTIDKDKHEGDLTQEQENQEIFSPDCSLPESSTSCEREILPVQLSSVPLLEHENLNSDFKQEDQAVEAIEIVKTANEDEDKDHTKSLYFEEQCADAEAQIEKFANLQLQFSDEEECSQEIDQVNSCYEETISENSLLDVGAFEVRNASVDDQHSTEVIQVIKETNAMDTAASGEHNLEAVHSAIQLVEKQSFEHDCQGNGSEDDMEASEMLAMDAVVVEMDLEAHSREVKDEVEESVFVHEEDDVEEEVEDDISEGAGNSTEQSNSDKIWPADSNQELLLELKDKKKTEEEVGMKIEDDKTCYVENCNSKSTQNDFALTSCQHSNDGKDDSAVNVTERYRTKLMNLDDVAAITRGRRVLLGVLLALIWYLCLKAFSLPALADSRF